MSALPLATEPRLKLSDLPAELKSKIAALCAEQDETFTIWSDAYAKANEHDVSQVEVLRKFHGFSLGALFCTSKEWSEIAAPFRFRVLKVSRTMHDSWRYLVVFRRVRHFTTLRIDTGDRAILQVFLPFLGQFTGIRTLAFAAPLLPHLLDLYAFTSRRIDWIADHRNARGIALGALHRLLLYAVRLELGLAGVTELRSTLHLAVHLRSLRVDLTVVGDAPATIIAILSTSSRGLEELELDCGDSVETDVRLGATEQKPSHRSIALNVGVIRPSHLRFVHLFAASLRRLRIVGPSKPADFSVHLPVLPVDVFADQPFIQLEQLEVVGSEDLTSLVFDLVHPSTFPSLLTLTCETTDLGAFEDGVPLELCVRSFLDTPGHPLKHARIYDPQEARCLLEYVEAQKLVERYGRSVVISPTDPYPHPTLLPPAPYAGSQFGETWRSLGAEGAVDRVMDYLARWHRRAQALGEGKEAEYHRLATVLRMAELDRVAMEG